MRILLFKVAWHSFFFFLASWFLEAFKFRVLVSVLCPIMPYKLWLTSLNKFKTRWLFQYHIHIKRHGIKRRNRQSYTSYQDPLSWLVLWFYCDHDAIQVLMRHIKLCGEPYLRSGLSLSLFSFLFFLMLIVILCNTFYVSSLVEFYCFQVRLLCWWTRESRP